MSTLLMANHETIMQIGSANFRVKIANNIEKARKGLSGYASMAKNEGMLLLYNRHYRPHIWMKGMMFPIDIVWIHQGHVKQITHNVPVPHEWQKNKLPIYSSEHASDMVLEINAGEADAQGIKLGDVVRFSK